VFSSSRLLLGVLACVIAQAHAVSISNGELRITDRLATFELRIPVYEVEAIANPEVTLLDELRFGQAVRTSSECQKDSAWLTCKATYKFPEPVSDTMEIECTLYRSTVPNHIHILYAALRQNSDQQVFDQNNSLHEIRFHPPFLWESLTRDASAGALRLLKSPAGLLFLVAVALAARSLRELALLGALFLAAESFVRPISPFIPLAMSPEFLEAVIALTGAYLAGELLLLPGGSARWAIVPLLGLFHGLPFVPFPPLYLAGAMGIQIAFFGLCGFATLRMRASLRPRIAGVLLCACAIWFARLLLA